ncbi:galactose mutarotase-like protein [Vararia minispora EC-137]|uniref:Galactose mutarotase-like protein n=1 Tax=Vararia minispora EC-137 TaxID=1314806 RepID=A0ACB8QS90_9AGAM|nr:galactose mutarotase-like protein [Vararia minispora EC-137]
MTDDASFQPILLSLPSLTPSLAAEVLPHGLTLHRLFLQADGRTHDLVVGPEDPTGHKILKYTNTVIGRYTNRVPTGPHTLTRNGITTTISPKATAESAPRVSLHGGPTGFDQLTVQHWGFNLEASLKDGSPSLSVKNHRLTIAAPHTVKIDGDGLATGELAPTSGTVHQHRSKLIGENFPEVAAEGSLSPGYGEYNHFYVFDKRDLGPSIAAKHRITAEEFTPELNAVADVLKPGAADGVVELASEKSGIRLVFGTNQSGVQFYSYNFASGEGSRKRIHGGSGSFGPGEGYPATSAVFLEFHEPLASYLHPGSNPSGDDTILAPGEIYNNYVRADVLYKTPNPL